MKLKQLVPMLNVSDIQRSLKFYEAVARFEQVSSQEELGKWNWAEIQLGDVLLMLAQARCPSAGAELEIAWPAIFYFYPEDVKASYEHVKGLGYEVGELSVTVYGMKECTLRDPDGHLLSFGQDAANFAPQAA